MVVHVSLVFKNLFGHNCLIDHKNKKKMFYGALVDNSLSRNFLVSYKYQVSKYFNEYRKYRVSLPSQVTVTEIRYYFAQVPSTLPNYKKKVPSRTTVVRFHTKKVL